jgi:hypothetical protein
MYEYEHAPHNTISTDTMFVFTEKGISPIDRNSSVNKSGPDGDIAIDIHAQIGFNIECDHQRTKLTHFPQNGQALVPQVPSLSQAHWKRKARTMEDPPDEVLEARHDFVVASEDQTTRPDLIPTKKRCNGTMERIPLSIAERSAQQNVGRGSDEVDRSRTAEIIPLSTAEISEVGSISDGQDHAFLAPSFASWTSHRADPSECTDSDSQKSDFLHSEQLVSSFWDPSSSSFATPMLQSQTSALEQQQVLLQRVLYFLQRAQLPSVPPQTPASATTLTYPPSFPATMRLLTADLEENRLSELPSYVRSHLSSLTFPEKVRTILTSVISAVVLCVIQRTLIACLVDAYP